MNESALDLLDRYREEVEVLFDERALRVLFELASPSVNLDINSLDVEGLRILDANGFLQPGLTPPKLTDRAITFFNALANDRGQTRRSASPDTTTTIAADCTFKGDILLRGAIVIDGNIEGRISTSATVQITGGGRLSADVEAESIVIQGDVRGNLIVGGVLHLSSSSRFDGEVSASRLTVDEGATVQGHFTIGPEATRKHPRLRADPVSHSAGTPADVASVHAVKV